MKTNILTAKGLSKTYVSGKNNRQQVLKEVDVEIKEGEFVSVMGSSGSGKSTLLYNMSGMDKMTSGSVNFDGQEMSDLSEEAVSKLRLHAMGFVFQQSSLLKNLTIFDNIVLSAYLAKKEPRDKINSYARELMEQTGISQIANNGISEVSGGQLQRAAICRALINRPKMLFGDEPTGALNSKAATEVMEILCEIHRAGTSILLVTHDAKIAAKTQRVLFMTDGSIIAEKSLGTYDPEKADSKEREAQLSDWLLELGF